MAIDKKTIDNLYFSRFIDSLEQDINKWEMRKCNGYDSSWTEYHGPEYKNESGEKLQFCFTNNDPGAYINGILMWKISFFNPFSRRGRRFEEARLKMIKACELKVIEERNNILFNAL